MTRKTVRIDYKALNEKVKQDAQNKPSKHGGRGRPVENQVVGVERRN